MLCCKGGRRRVNVWTALSDFQSGCARDIYHVYIPCIYLACKVEVEYITAL